MCQMLWFIHVEVVFGMKMKMLLLASLYVFITTCNKLYFPYGSHCVIHMSLQRLTSVSVYILIREYKIFSFFGYGKEVLYEWIHCNKVVCRRGRRSKKGKVNGTSFQLLTASRNAD